MCDVPDHPVIRNLMETGYPDGKEPDEILCPVCGEDGEFFYQNRAGHVVGCERCLTVRHYYEVNKEELS